ncbi:hypothetical protein DRE_04899 [Drechslerella stenobrocha 248]|uniref:Uncharacterized protein n=1 Tax=Drechslerella stenobrocha 248 TaxID=1043628 RepID=W7I085_9PEZI|nr:hypothetical protein DRE_04899 [Drechslerella stenobrocha 248]
MESESSALPLYKRGSRTSSVGSRKTLLSHSRTISSSHDQITPPPTPKDGSPKQTSGGEPSTEPSNHEEPRGDQPREEQTQATRPKSHSSHTSSKRSSRPTKCPTFMRAFYSFRPVQAADAATVTIPLTPGDMILIHNIHENGWADGTTIASGARGWLPTNFCASYEVDEMQLLLNACIAVFEYYRGTSAENFASARERVVGDVVNGVRQLLEATDCLTRESTNVQTDETIRKTRKVLLAELSVLVKTSRRFPEDEFEEEMSGLTAQDVLDELILSAFRVVVCGAKFLDGWCDIHDPVSDGEVTEAQITTVEEADEESESCRNSTKPNEASGNRDSTQTALTTALDAYTTTREKPQGLTIITSQYQPDDQATFAALTPASTVKESDSDNETPEVKAEPQVEVDMAAAQLNRNYDSLLSCLATYIGTIHLKAPLPSRLFVLTKDAVEVGKEFLKIVDLVQERGDSENLLDNSKNVFQEEINVLVTEAQRLVKPLRENEVEAPLAGSESQPLIDAATKCVQGATQCFDVALNIIEKVGNFELTVSSKPAVSQIGIGITTTVLAAPVVDGINRPNSPSSPEFSSSPQSSSSEPPSPATAKLNLDKSLPMLPTVSSVVPKKEVEDTVTVVALPVPPPKDTPTEDKHQSLDSTAATSVSMQREDSQQSGTSEDERTSTRATTPNHEDGETPLASPMPPVAIDASVPSTDSESHTDSVPTSPVDEKVSASGFHNLVIKDGQIQIASAGALVEQMTMPDSKPDIIFVTAFFTTFRFWSSPAEITKALISRFDEIDSSLPGSTPVRLRVYNVFKQWLETHWKKELDIDVLPLVREFAVNKLTPVLQTPGERLQELVDKVLNLETDTSLVPREPATLQKTRSTVGLSQMAAMPEPRITRTQYNVLRTFQANGGDPPSILEFDPHEIAKQLTVKDQDLFCQIAPHELLGKEWTKKEGSRAVNVSAMTHLSTDMAHWVAFTILNDADPKRRAAVIKHWIKVADKLFEMANYNTLMAVMCSLNTSTIIRLKKTWELVSPRSKAALEKLRSVVDCSKNYTELRNRLRNQLPPCLPFLGTYLTDMVFLVDGNPEKKPFPGEDPKKPTGINFTKYLTMIKMIQELQSFQVPYPIQEVPEFQYWLDYQMRTLRESGFGDVQKLYRQSLAVEPKKRDPAVPPVPTPTITIDPTVVVPSPAVATPTVTGTSGGLLGWTQIIKEKSSIASFNLAINNP